MQDNEFYRRHHHHAHLILMAMIVIVVLLISVLFYQVLHRPLPIFYAIEPKGKQLLLAPSTEPNLLPDTILRWAGKAATVAYTFDFVNYSKQISAARPYFTADGWQDYLRSVDNVIKTIVQNQLVSTGVVAGPAVISNQGVLPGKGYSWRIQVPFLVNYQSANTTSRVHYYVILTVVRVPTVINPQGIGIDQFVMVSG